MIRGKERKKEKLATEIGEIGGLGDRERRALRGGRRRRREREREKERKRQATEDSCVPPNERTNQQNRDQV